MPCGREGMVWELRMGKEKEYIYIYIYIYLKGLLLICIVFEM